MFFSWIRTWSITRRLTFSFALVILIGSILLSLPFFQYQNASESVYLDHLFNVVSMVCVTGLSVIPISDSIQRFWSDGCYYFNANWWTGISYLDCF